jgi:hypothetical protein
MTMDIQDVVTCAGPLDAGSGQRRLGASRERPGGVRDGDTDQFIVSGQAKTMYEAERAHKFDVVRDRVRLGYYLQKGVLDQVVDALAKDVSTENAAPNTF